MKLKPPSPALVIACVALFVSLGGVSYAVATIDSGDIVNGSIRNRDFREGTLRGNESKPDGFGPKAIKEQALDASKLDASKLGPVPNANIAQGLGRFAVVNPQGGAVRSRGAASVARTGQGQYLAIFDRDVRGCAYFATIGDESASAPGAGVISVTSAAGNVNGVRVIVKDGAGGELIDRSFHLIVSC
jgi:hypothetical protein